MGIFEKSCNFIYCNARPIDLARWQYHFENGSKENVLRALPFYQNEDGGFGNGLEADCWNPTSSPIQTWCAAEILREIGYCDSKNNIIKGILKYLASGKDFNSEKNQWMNTIESNNNYPHAIWWEHSDSGDEYLYNPTASLAGFIIKFADKNSDLYKLGCKIAKEAIEFLINNEISDSHVVACYTNLLDYCRETKTDIFDIEVFEENLKQKVSNCISKDINDWNTSYVCKPSHLFNSPNSVFYSDNKDIADYECEYIEKNQLNDGSYAVTWQWFNDYKEFEVAANWWKSFIIVNNMIYLRNFGRL